MMYRWWCESGGDRTWWVIESVFLRSPDKGFWACLGDLPPDMPIRPETWVSLYNLMMKHRGMSRSSAILGSDSPQSNNRKDNSLWVTPFIPSERPNVKHAIGGYLRLPRPTSAPALMRVLHWLRCWEEEPGYSTGNPPEDYDQIRGGCSCPWMITVARHNFKWVKIKYNNIRGKGLTLWTQLPRWMKMTCFCGINGTKWEIRTRIFIEYICHINCIVPHISPT